jgi:TIR domain
VNRPAAAAARDAVFVSYSHDDQDWRRKFTQILAPLVRNRRLVLWDDTLIPVGGDWRRDIDDGVRRAGAALLLVTGSYLASRFIMEEELPALVAYGVRLVPVLVEDCLWDYEPLLAAVRWVGDPGRDGPLAAGQVPFADRVGEDLGGVQAGQFGGAQGPPQPPGPLAVLAAVVAGQCGGEQLAVALLAGRGGFGGPDRVQHGQVVGVGEGLLAGLGGRVLLAVAVQDGGQHGERLAGRGGRGGGG